MPGISPSIRFLLMNLSDLRRMLEVSVSRDDLAGDYDNWINRGLKAIQRDYNFLCMKTTADIVCPAAASSAPMPDDFKQLCTERGSVSLVDPAGSGLLPLEVKSRERLICLARVPNRTVVPYVYLENDGKDASLNMLDSTTSETTFRIAYYRFLPDLSADDDENYFTTMFEDMVQARIKAVAFSIINDPMETVELTKYKTVHLPEAKVFDTHQRTQGRSLQLGG